MGCGYVLILINKINNDLEHISKVNSQYLPP